MRSWRVYSAEMRIHSAEMKKKKATLSNTVRVLFSLSLCLVRHCEEICNNQNKVSYRLTVEGKWHIEAEGETMHRSTFINLCVEVRLYLNVFLVIALEYWSE